MLEERELVESTGQPEERVRSASAAPSHAPGEVEAPELAPGGKRAQAAAEPAARGDGWSEPTPHPRAPERPRSLTALARTYIPRAHLIWPGNDCRLLRDGVEAYPAMLEAIRGARRSVRLETYMFIDDAVGELFGRALAEAARRGVQVRVLYDALGSWTSKASFFEGLRAQGVDIHPFKPFSFQTGFRRLIRRDHRKILIVDGEIAFTGGVNISAKWAPKGAGEHCVGEGWRDDVLRIEGPAVHQLERCFVASWRLQLADRFRELRRKRRTTGLRLKGEVPVAVLSSRRSIHRAYLHAIARARRSVFVAAAYFIPDRKMVAALKAAAGRGVDVSLILSGKSDHRWLTFATRAFYDRLLEAGVKIFEWGECVLHSKTAVIDGTWGTIGSFNLERTSLWLNHEVNAVFADRHLGQQLESSLRSDCRSCVPIKLEDWRRRPLWQKVIERVLYLFRKVL